MRKVVHGKRLIIAVAVIVTALAFGVSGGLAKSGPSQVKAPVQFLNANCGFPTTKKKIGKATFITDKGVLTVRMKLHGALPGHYRLELWDGATCTFIAKLDEFSVDGSGDGEAVGAIVVAGQTFFATALNTDLGLYNDSLIVKVGGLL